ncbi:hypothetical protein, partial [uncultured Adlercreutzia sp.]
HLENRIGTNMAAETELPMKITIEGDPSEVRDVLKDIEGHERIAPEGLLSTRELAKLLGIHPSRVQRLASDGIFDRMQDENGYSAYDAAASVKSYCAHMRANVHRKDAKEVLAAYREAEPKLVEVILEQLEKRAEPLS